MDWLQRLWNGIKEPMEEAAKAAIKLVFAPSLRNPAEMASALPANMRDEYTDWVREPKNALMAGALISAAQELALSAAEKINPSD